MTGMNDKLLSLGDLPVGTKVKIKDTPHYVYEIVASTNDTVNDTVSLRAERDPNRTIFKNAVNARSESFEVIELAPLKAPIVDDPSKVVPKEPAKDTTTNLGSLPLDTRVEIKAYGKGTILGFHSNGNVFVGFDEDKSPHSAKASVFPIEKWIREDPSKFSKEVRNAKHAMNFLPTHKVSVIATDVKTEPSPSIIEMQGKDLPLGAKIEVDGLVGVVIGHRSRNHESYVVVGFEALYTQHTAFNSESSPWTFEAMKDFPEDFLHDAKKYPGMKSVSNTQSFKVLDLPKEPQKTLKTTTQTEVKSMKLSDAKLGDVVAISGREPGTTVNGTVIAKYGNNVLLGWSEKVANSTGAWPLKNHKSNTDFVKGRFNTYTDSTRIDNALEYDYAYVFSKDTNCQAVSSGKKPTFKNIEYVRYLGYNPATHNYECEVKIVDENFEWLGSGADTVLIKCYEEKNLPVPENFAAYIQYIDKTYGKSHGYTTDWMINHHSQYNEKFAKYKDEVLKILFPKTEATTETKPMATNNNTATTPAPTNSVSYQEASDLAASMLLSGMVDGTHFVGEVDKLSKLNREEFNALKASVARVEKEDRAFHRLSDTELSKMFDKVENAMKSASELFKEFPSGIAPTDHTQSTLSLPLGTEIEIGGNIGTVVGHFTEKDKTYTFVASNTAMISGHPIKDDKSLAEFILASPENYTSDVLQYKTGVWYEHNQPCKILRVPPTSVRTYKAQQEQLKTEKQTNKETKTMSNETTTSDTKPGFFDTLKSEGKEATYRVISTQLIKAVKTGIVNLLKNKGTDGGKLQAISEFFDTEIGEAIISNALGHGLQFLPGNLGSDPRVQKIAKEFRVQGYAMVGNELVGTAMEYVVPAITNALKDLPPLEGDTTTKARVSEHKNEEVASEEHEETEETSGKKASA